MTVTIFGTQQTTSNSMFKIYTNSSQSNPASRLVRAIVTVSLGIVITFWPGATIEAIVKLAGLMLIIEGIVSFLLSQRRRIQNPDLIVLPRGIVDLIIGIILMVVPKEASALFVFLIGMLLVFGSFSQVLLLITFLRAGIKSWSSTIIMLVPFVAGLFIIFNPIKVADSAVIIIGLALIAYGASELYFYFKSRNNTPSNNNRASGNQPIDIDYEEITD